MTRTFLAFIVLVSVSLRLNVISYSLYSSFLGSFLGFFDARWNLWFLITLVTRNYVSLAMILMIFSVSAKFPSWRLLFCSRLFLDIAHVRCNNHGKLQVSAGFLRFCHTVPHVFGSLQGREGSTGRKLLFSTCSSTYITVVDRWIEHHWSLNRESLIAELGFLDHRFGVRPASLQFSASRLQSYTRMWRSGLCYSQMPFEDITSFATHFFWLFH